MYARTHHIRKSPYVRRRGQFGQTGHHRTSDRTKSPTDRALARSPSDRASGQAPAGHLTAPLTASWII
jgi:hypothetical protein